MLASTVQFSNNDQPPITPPSQASSLGPASRRTSNARTLRHPTACPTPSTATPHVPHPDTPSSTGRRKQSSVPNNQRSTHEQPAPDTRRCTGPRPTPAKKRESVRSAP